jgi:hypothetical protein
LKKPPNYSDAASRVEWGSFVQLVNSFHFDFWFNHGAPRLKTPQRQSLKPKSLVVKTSSTDTSQSPVSTMTGDNSSYPPKILSNYVGGTFTSSSSSRTLAVTNPYDGSTITSVVMSNAKDLDVAVEKAQSAFETWSKINIKTRVLKLMKLHQLMTENLDELAELVVKEHGKNIVEAKASITKGMETLEVPSPSVIKRSSSMC